MFIFLGRYIEINGFKFHDTKYVTPVTFVPIEKSPFLQFTCGLDTLTESGCWIQSKSSKKGLLIVVKVKSHISKYYIVVSQM